MARNVGRGLVLLVLALTLACCGGDGGEAPAPTQQPASVAPSVAPSEATQKQPSPPSASPTHLDIPAIGLSESMIALGLNEDGTVEVPKDPERVGWFDLGTVPGQRGSAVILGHVDSLTGPAVFADLAALRPGDQVEVDLSDDTTVTFRVHEVATFANADFPAERVYSGSPDRAALNLVTCGGEYDRDRGGYQSNVVVFTQRVAG